jgi:hypothetical protein
MLKQFVHTLKDYKEVLGAVIAIVGGVLLIMDYFATKIEVSILQCQMQSNISLVDSRMQGDQLARQIISLKTQSARISADRVRQSEIELEIDKLRRDLVTVEDNGRTAAKNLQPGACEKMVRSK